MAGTDVNVIAAAAGVAHGTFFFHFPSKEHVLFELESREEELLAARLGPILFKELLALHFSPTRPHKDAWNDHPVIVLLVGEFERARGDGVVHPHPEVDAFYSGTFFFLGVYGVLISTDDRETRDTLLAKLIATHT